ncbi:ROK family protein [Bacillus sp. DX4.1]|uniref:ROK family protein n=1 Tax=Bacillus sp. DX4.1 TaxID=3055867 RepID=UPI0025A05000|nr:ROK family protein [Bacillus sp. DX4.1]MDM5186779.1 ROK family protein [Bacillus sp. DX4.1]
MRLGGIEAGGTKFVCGIGDETGNILERISFPTTTPEETMKQAISFFKGKKLDAIGVGSFGPVDLDETSDTYGYITSTPKPHWNNYNILGKLKEHFSIPIAFDTDVNAAALGEIEWGAAQDVDSCIYITVGTGIGVGAIVEGKLLHGMSHPEMGHILVRTHPEDSFTGNCPFHQHCLEGMAAGPAIEKRWGKRAVELEHEEKVWKMEAFYLAQALMNYILILSPKKIIMGGGVMKQRQLFPLIYEQLQDLLNNYIKVKQLDQYVVAPKLGDNAGLCGALALAKREVLLTSHK